MTSRNSFWKYSKWNLKRRIWALVLLLVVWFFALPVSVFSKAGIMIREAEQGLQPLEEKLEWINSMIVNGNISGKGLYGVFTVAMGIFLALQGFAWNNHQSRVDMYKSVPVKEDTRFWYINFNSFLIFTLSFGGNMILANVSAAIWGVWNGQFLAASVFSFFVNLLLFISVYFVTLIAQMMTGNIALGFCGASLLLLIEPACFLVCGNLMSLYYDTYMDGVGIYDVFQEGIASPLSAYISMYKSVSMKSMGFANMKNYGEIWKYLILFLIQIILYGGIAYMLHRKRPSQTGGRTMIFPKTKPVIKCVVMILGSLAFGTFLAGFDARAKVWYGLFGVLCGLLILQAVLQVIMEGDFKEVLKGKISFGIATAVSVVIFAIFVFDLTGFDSYLPREEKVESFAFIRAYDYCYNLYDEDLAYTSTQDYLLENMKIEDGEAKEILLSELKQAIENDDYYYKDDDENIDTESVKAKLADMGTASGDYEDGNYRETVYIKFRLTSGKEVVRRYYLSLQRIRNCYCYLYELEEYKESVYSALKDYIADEFLNSENNRYVHYYSYPSMTESEDNTKDPALANKFFLAMQSDLRNRTSEVVMTMAPVGELNIAVNYKNASERKNVYVSMPVYMADEETVALLKENGWFREADMDKWDINMIRVFQYTEYGHSDKRKVLEIKPQDDLFDSVMGAFCLSESLNDVVDPNAFIKRGYYAEIEMTDGYRTYAGVLFLDKFPEELEKAFEHADDYDEEFSQNIGA